MTVKLPITDIRGIYTNPNNRGTMTQLVEDAGQNVSGTRVLTSGSGSVSTSVVTVTVPDDAMGFRLYATTNPIRFAINEDPATVGTLASLTVGGIAKADMWETRIIAIGTSRTLRLLGTTATTVDVEFF